MSQAGRARVRGVIIDAEGGPVGGAVVEVWRADLVQDAPISQASADHAGQFVVELAHDPTASVFFRVSRDGKHLLSTRRSLHSKLTKADTPVVLRIGTSAAVDVRASTTVAGRLLDSQGNPISAEVRAIAAGQVLQSDVTSELGVFSSVRRKDEGSSG